MRRIYVSRILEGATYDAQKMIHDGNVRGAFNLLAKKLLEIQRYEHRTKEFRLVWDDALQTMHRNVEDQKDDNPMREM